MSKQQVILAGRYALEAEVARGGMAVVWRATDQVLARTVAIKLLYPHLADDAAFLERFRREALAAARLAHPNIVAIYDTGNEVTEVDGVDRHFIVMEFCGGGTLADLAARQGTMNPGDVAAIGATICDALGYAHEQGVIHRDIKPGNVLIAEHGALKVADFGIAKAVEAARDLTTTGVILGTVAYLSPEQAQGAEPDARSDLYSLGIVLYELVVGRPPFVGETAIATAMKHVREPPPPPRSIHPAVPRALEATLLKALEKDPDRRFTSAHEMGAALRGAAAGPAGTAVLPVRERTRPTRERAAADHRLPSLWPVLALVALAIAAALLLPGLLERNAPGTGSGPTEPSDRVTVASVADFDPYSEGRSEHPEEAPLAADGDPATAWSTETYNDPLELLGKPGVGLVLDLGEPTTVARVEVLTSSPGFAAELRAANEVGDTETAFDEIAEVDAAEAETVFDIDPIEARYWLLWITRLPGDGGGRASIGEVRFFAD